MRVLLTGANGTVGTAVTDHLDHEFTLLDQDAGEEWDGPPESRGGPSER